MGVVLCACISATIVEESTPPERNTPSGTSATIRRLTALPRSFSRATRASSAEPSNGCRTPRSATSAADQYPTGVGDASPSSIDTLSRVAGGILKTPR